MVDEADIDMVGATSSTSKGGLKRSLPASDGGGSLASKPPSNKRKPGPIPKDVVVRRPSYTPTNTPPSSPVPWVDDTKNQVIPTADSNQVSSNITNSTPSVSNAPCINSPEKLVNGLAEMPTIPVFEPIPVEHTNNHMDAPPTLTPVVNNVDTPKGEVKTEKTENVKNECNNLPLNDCVENSVKVENSVDERLSNHVEEKSESKVEKDKVLTKKELEDIRRHNLSVRELVYKEVRRRGTSKLKWIRISIIFLCISIVYEEGNLQNNLYQ